MGVKKTTAACALLIVLLLLATDGTGKGAVEAILHHHCKTPSRTFKGLCVSDSNCAQVCRSEGFPGGDCHGVRRRCMCC
nr:defensin 4 [Zingiber officinale]